MKELKGSKTEQNLMTAFAGESQAHTKYQYYASKAKKDGYVQMAAIFEETAKNEKEHAKIWFKLLHDGMPGTIENLKDAAAAAINFALFTTAWPPATIIARPKTIITRLLATDCPFSSETSSSVLSFDT